MTSDRTVNGICQGLQGISANYEWLVFPALQGFWHPPVWAQVAQAVASVHFAFKGVDWPRLQQGMLELPLRARKVVHHLGKHGWFFDLEMALSNIGDFERLVTEGNTVGLDAVLVEHFKKRTVEIETQLVFNYPRRASILRSAFSAHSKEEYALSIPVFLAQAEGICVDLISYSCFTKNKHNGQKCEPSTASFVNSIATGSSLDALLSPLAESLPISASAKDRSIEEAHFNRHMILHGESVDYGTEGNSLKAISFLNYIGGVLAKAKGRKEKALSP